MLQSSLLPKLLAKEDITIRHGNYHTAWFDVKNRVLGLPNWKDMGKDVYDLLCGHEVGHALFTPESGWHDSPEKLAGAPRSYLNVIEDARIERDIRSAYPGLIAAMQRGYNELLKREFFGDIHNLEWDQVKLIDKINLKTKLGSKLDVPFNAEEKVFLDRAFTNQNFDDVIQLAKDVLAYTKENQEELLQPEEKSEKLQNLEDLIDQLEDALEENDGPPPQGHDDMEPQEQQAPAPSEENTPEGNEEGDQQSETKIDKEPTPEKVIEDLKEKLEQLSSSPEHTPDQDISITDEAYRSNEESLLDVGKNGEGTTIFNELRPYYLDNTVIGYDQLKKERGLGLPVNHANFNDFKKYVKDCKRSVNFAVKEFEQRKAAFRYQRATTAKTGRLDVSKLWAYKTSEDIFSQVTTLADSKNHGMIMLIDYSGSMSQSMNYVMDQLLHMVHFCKAINIPFDVYGFTTQNKTFNYDNEEFQAQLQDGDVDMNNLTMPLVCSSSFNKKDFQDAIFHMYLRQRTDNYWNDDAPLAQSEYWGSTPLDQALIVSHTLVKQFKIKHQVEKMNFVTFTDGDANGLNNVQMKGLDDKKIDTKYHGRKLAIINKKKVDLGNRYNTTDLLLKNLSKSLNTKTMGFFMADDSHHWRNRINRLSGYVKDRDMYDREFFKECAKEYTKNKCVHKQDAFGYDNYYLLKGGKTLSATDGEFDDQVHEDMSDAQIRNAFKKFAKGKKTNKVLMTSIGKAVA